MSTETSDLLKRAKRQLRKVETVDESKQHGYLGRVIDYSPADKSKSSEQSSEPAVPSREGKKSYTGTEYDDRPVGGRTLSLKDAPSETKNEPGESKSEEITSPGLGMRKSTSGLGIGESSSGSGMGERSSSLGMGESSAGLGIEKDTRPGTKESSATQESKGVQTSPILIADGTSGKSAVGGEVSDEMDTLGEEEDEFDLCYVEDIDVPEQLKTIEEDLEKLMHKLRLSEDRIRKHQIRKEQNLSIQRDAGIKAAELNSMCSEKEKLKKQAVERQIELENQRAEAHRAAINYEVERARLRASELATLEIQKIASQRIKDHERGIKYGETIKKRLEIQISLLKTQKDLLMFEGEMKDVLNDRPPLHHPSVNILHEVPTEKLQEHRVYNEFPEEKGIASGVFEEEFTVLGDNDVPLRDSTFSINTVDPKNQ